MKSCQKKSFESEESARRMHCNASYRVRPYLCPRCFKWHVTNSDKKDNARPHVQESRQRREQQRSLERPEVTDPAIVAEIFARAAARKGMRAPADPPEEGPREPV
jgi:hypothetical protein